MRKHPSANQSLPAILRQKAVAPAPSLGGDAVGVGDEAGFTRQIYLERRRAERNQRSLLLVLMDGMEITDSAGRAAGFRILIGKLSGGLRDTDALGWYRQGMVLGILLPDLERANPALLSSVFGKFSSLLEDALGAELARRMRLTVHVFPTPLGLEGEPADLALYPELPGRGGWRLEAALKRGLDVSVSLLALLLLSPLFAVLAVAVKFSSRGPALFRQTRLGHYGKPFSLLKFRSMYTDSGSAVHEQYVAKLIAGELVESRNGIFKITDDPRVTTVGRILRRTSLDELPQLLNVLWGEMSLVGPRPPLSYEYERYACWHRRRVLEVKPGMTGLWQVQGRSGTSFDEMVRLDLRYARRQSLWLDLKILWQTPGVMLSGKGAY
jgi:lipopolysaccharide/colanic/teichoic acid biosynthesis glycosyltransferase